MLSLEFIIVIVFCIKDVFYFWLVDIYTSVGVPLLISLCVGNSSVGEFFLGFSAISNICKLADYIAQ